jgi:hypothetical protein
MLRLFEVLYVGQTHLQYGAVFLVALERLAMALTDFGRLLLNPETAAVLRGIRAMKESMRWE